ncbi:MAG TPA: hypothetical protein VHA14_03560, partial [Bryobacteraceae bacterium]|nr:hypothetical protein [Bryobacteraceae bacterium]
MWRSGIVALVAAAAVAQQIAPIDKLPGAARIFETTQGAEPMPCTVQFAKPQLNLGFRFESKYTVRASLDAYAGAQHRWRIEFRVTPAGRQPVYFVDSLDLSPPPEPGFDAIATGAFFTGEGDYDVKWALWDDLGRVCRSESKVEAHLGTREHVKVLMPPDAIGDFSWQPPSEVRAVAKTRRVTILMNAAIPIAKGGQQADNEWPALLAILSSLLERMPDANVRLVLFNLDQQRELLRKDGFTAKDVAGIAHATDVLARWQVDANVLHDPLGGWELIRNLENRETEASPPAEAIVFLGLPAATAQKMPDEMPQSGSAHASRFFYLCYRPPDGLDTQRARSGMGPIL